MRQLSMELRNEIVDMTKNGHSISEIHNATKVSKGAIRKYQSLAGLRSTDANEHGGVVSRTIPVKHFADKEEVEVLPVMIADQQITIVGTETMTKYHACSGKDIVTIEGDGLVGEIKIEDILKISEELRGVYNFVTKMKSNRWDIVT